MEPVAEFYDPGTNTFVSGPTMKFTRADHTATLVGSTVVFVGGVQSDAFNREPISQVESYSASLGFVTTGSLAVNRARFATVNLGSSLLVAGGFGASALTGRSAELFSTTGAEVNIQPAAIPDGQVGVGYGPQSLTATGGTPPYTLSLVSGQGPAGLTLTLQSTPSLGQFRYDIAGTPTAPGTYAFNLKATYPGGNTMIQPYSIRIDPLNITTSIMPNGTVGTSYSQPLTATTVHGPVTWTIVSNTGADVSSGNGLPNGLTLNSNGTVSGTPLTSGGFFFTVRARDSLGQKTTRLIALQVQ